MSNNISVKFFEHYTRHLTTEGSVLTAGGQGGVVGLPLLPSLAPGPGVDRPPLPAGEHSLHHSSHTLKHFSLKQSECVEKYEGLIHIY